MEACELYDSEPSEGSSDGNKRLPAFELWSRHVLLQLEAAAEYFQCAHCFSPFFHSESCERTSKAVESPSSISLLISASARSLKSRGASANSTIWWGRTAGDAGTKSKRGLSLVLKMLIKSFLRKAVLGSKFTTGYMCFLSYRAARDLIAAKADAVTAMTPNVMKTMNVVMLLPVSRVPSCSGS